MLLIGHTAVGMAVSLVTNNPWAAFGIGVVSHHFADMVPHFDAGSFRLEEKWQPQGIKDFSVRDLSVVAADLVLTLILLFMLWPYLSSFSLPVVWGGIIGANLPDFIHNVPFWDAKLKQIRWIHWWHEKIHEPFHWTVPARFWYLGIATQLAIIGLVVWLFIR